MPRTTSKTKTPPPLALEPLAYDRETTAYLLGCSVRQLRRRVEAGLIRAIRDSDASPPFFTRAEIDRYLRDQRDGVRED